MLLDDRLFQQEWVQNLSNEDFRMLMYLFFFASKSGIIELNMRMLNFSANTGKMYTKEDVLERFKSLIRLVPGRDNTAIFPDWIATNWSRGKPIDATRNPLFKSIVNELSSFGLTIDMVNAMAKKKIELKGDMDGYIPVAIDPLRADGGESKKVDAEFDFVKSTELITAAFNRKDQSTSRKDIETMFEAFWKEWPKTCPRKTDKKKCRDKFFSYLHNSKDAVQLFNKIMNGLSKWKECDTWVRDGGQYIMAPSRWLNNRNWEDEPMKGGYYGNKSRSVATANANFKSSDANGIF